MEIKRSLFLPMVIISTVLLASCGNTITQADLEAAYQQGYNDGHVASDDINTQNQTQVNDIDENNEIAGREEPESQKETILPAENTDSQPSANSENVNSSSEEMLPGTPVIEDAEEVAESVPDIVYVIATMQATAPVIDTRTIKYNEGTPFESDALYQPGEHIGEYNGIQVDNMLNLSSRANQEKYYVVADDLVNVENTLRNAYGKNWLGLGYTNCVPAIRYDSRRNIYGDNPYDMVHPGWQHTYAVLYSCTWSDGTPRCGVYYITVSNDTDNEIMAILCPIQSITDGMNFLC